RRAGFAPDCERVGTQQEYLARLTPDLDVILADCSRRSFTALEALRLLHQRSLDIPFLVIVGRGRCDAAAECLRHGADDYVLQDRLPRLGFAVGRAVASRRLREDRRRGQDPASVSAHQWHATFDAIRDPVLLLDAGGRIVRCNQAAFDFVGQHRTDIVGRGCCEVLRQGLGQIEGCPYTRALESMERESVTWEREGRWIEVVVDPIVDADGFLVGFVLLLEDITQRRLAQEALRRSERRLSQIIEGTALAAFVLDADHTVTHWNRACEVLTGTPGEEVIGTRAHWKPFYSRQRPLLADLVLDGAAESELRHHYGDHGRPCPLIEGAYEAETFLPHLGSEGRWLSCSAAPLRDRAGEIAGVVEIMHDITERKRAQETLEQRVLELTLLNEVGNRITRAAGLESVLQSTVDIVQRSFGYHHVAILVLDRARETLILRAIAGRFTDILAAGLEVGLDEGIIGAAARGAETVLVNDVAADARYKMCYPELISTRSELSVPIRTGAGVMGVLDIQSERRAAFTRSDLLVAETLAAQIAVALENARLLGAERAARQQLRRLAGYLQDALEQERTHIAREIHDELGQMMTALKMDLSWLADRLPRDMPELLRRARRMSGALDSCLQAVRRVSTELRPGVLDDLGLPAAIEWQAEEFTERTGIRCQLHLDQAGESLDRPRATALFRILQEALTNVSRHADASQVRIRLQVDPDTATLTVQDDGRGVTPEQLADSQSLGLIGMQERARALGGDVSFEGCPDEGTTVTARISRRR
ncbi:MAG: PAS domain-containing protein, partial [Chloroflexota bacterium]